MVIRYLMKLYCLLVSFMRLVLSFNDLLQRECFEWKAADLGCYFRGNAISTHFLVRLDELFEVLLVLVSRNPTSVNIGQTDGDDLVVGQALQKTKVGRFCV